MDLKALRDEIDRLDGEIIERLRARARLAKEVGAAKRSDRTEAYAPAREAEIFRHIATVDTSPLPAEAVKAIYTEIIAACRALEEPLAVACLGPAHTFTHEAAVRRFGKATRYVTTRSVQDTFDEVAKGNADLGLVVIENSIQGVETPTLDAFVTSDLQVCSEVLVPIHQCLLAQCDLEEIEAVFSHPQPFAQCRRWLRENLPEADLIEEASTVTAAERAARTPRSAAIASAAAAEPHGLRILARNIEDNPNNRTRFLVIGRHGTPPSGRDKTFVLFSTKHEPGALLSALQPLQEKQLNMTLIESRPNRVTAWEYLFFIEFVGHRDEPHVRAALDELRQQCLHVKVLGSYPEASEAGL
jgi:chorismate mutase/prephenate dehydratase